MHAVGERHLAGGIPIWVSARRNGGTELLYELVFFCKFLSDVVWGGLRFGLKHTSLMKVNDYLFCSLATVEIHCLRVHGCLCYFRHRWLDHVEESHRRDQVRCHPCRVFLLCSHMVAVYGPTTNFGWARQRTHPITGSFKRRRTLSRTCRWLLYVYSS